MKPCSSNKTSLGLSALNLNSSSSPSFFISFWPWNCWKTGLFITVVKRHSLILSSVISFDTTNTFFLWWNAILQAKLTVNLLLPALDGIAYVIISPFRRPLNTFVIIGNGSGIPSLKSFWSSSQNLAMSWFNTAWLNLFVTLICFIAASTSSADISLYLIYDLISRIFSWILCVGAFI